MLECYVGFQTSQPLGSEKLTTCVGLLAHSASRDSFDRHWRFLLLRGDLPVGEPDGWQSLVRRPGPRDSQHRALIDAFFAAATGHEALPVVVGMGQSTWSRLSAARRRAFGSIEVFCFLRVMRLVIDRMESVGEPARIGLLLRRDSDMLGWGAQTAALLLRMDSRASERIASIAFVDPRQACRFAAVDVVLHAALLRLAAEDATTGKRPPPALQIARELPPLGESVLIERWDDTHVARHFDSLEWSLPARVPSRPTAE